MGRQQFQELFVAELRELYSAENQLLEKLPTVIDASNSSELKKALRSHLILTQTQIERLKRIFEFLNEDSSGMICEAMRGLVDEVQEVTNAQLLPIVKDAAIIARMRYIDYFTIAGYDVARTFAKHLNYDDPVDWLKESFLDVKEMSESLTSIAEGGFFTNGINALAAEA